MIFGSYEKLKALCISSRRGARWTLVTWLVWKFELLYQAVISLHKRKLITFPTIYSGTGSLIRIEDNDLTFMQIRSVRMDSTAHSIQHTAQHLSEQRLACQKLQIRSSPKPSLFLPSC